MIAGLSRRGWCNRAWHLATPAGDTRHLLTPHDAKYNSGLETFKITSFNVWVSVLFDIKKGCITYLTPKK